MNLRWYESFFQGIALEMWRKAVPPEQTRAEADFLGRVLDLRPGGRVLDVPCGLGRHALELASRGFTVTGVDLSEEAIEETRKAAAGRGVKAEFLRVDMRALPWRSEFDGAFCFGNSFGYLEPDATRDFVRAVSRVLKPGARFAMDSGAAAESILPRRKDREWMQFEDILFLEENRYHVEESCVETTYTFVRGGETQTRTGLQWIYTLREIRALLASEGLIPEKVVGSISEEPFDVGSPYLILVARKE